MDELFKREVFRPIATLFVPGGIALLPFGAQLLFTFPDLSHFAQSNPGASITLFTMLAIAVGMVLEDLGSRVEVLWDTRLDKGKAGVREPGRHTAIWNEYLQLTYDTEPVGQHYLRSVLLRFKFELSMVVAIPISWLGAFWLHMTIDIWASWSFIVGSAVALVLEIYLIYESCSSGEVLGTTRAVLVERYGGGHVRGSLKGGRASSER